MNQKKSFLHLGFLIFLIQISHSQVGIGTTTPEGALDVFSANDGLLIPRVALTNTATATIATPIKSELVYNTASTGDVTPGYYYWETTPTVTSDRWIRLVASGSEWSINGNAGTTAGTHFIGTTDAQDFRIKTGMGGVDRWNISNTNNGQLQSYSLGTAAIPTYSWQTDPNTGIFRPGLSILGFSTNSSERMRIEADGDVGIGTSSAAHKLSVRHDQDGVGVMSVDNATSGGFSGVYFLQSTAYRGHIGYVNTGGASGFGGKGFYQLASGDRPMIFSVGTAGSELFLERMRISQIGNVGIGITNPTAKLNLAAGTTTASTAPLKFTSGTNLTTPEDGAMEFDGTNYFVSSGATPTRYIVAKILIGSTTFNFGSLANESTNPLTTNITVTGAQIGDPVILGLPDDVMNSNSERHAHFMAWVSAADTVTIKFSNPTENSIDPSNGTYKVSVVRY